MRTFRFGTSWALLLLPVATAQATDWFVDNNAAGDVAVGGGGTPTVSDPAEDGSMAHPFDAIQEAIDAAVSGDRVIVRPGVYAGPAGSNYNTNLNFGGKPISVMAPMGAAVTAIDGGGSDRAFIFNSGETSAARVVGLRIFNGASASGGGAVHCDSSDPTFVGCRFESNATTHRGGAAYLVLSAPQFRDCQFRDNTATGFGGAIYALGADAEFSACHFEANSAEEGGAIHMLSNADCVFTDTDFVLNTASSAGGALYIDNDSDAQLTECLLSENESAGDGGAIYLDRGSSVLLDESALELNAADARGGGAFVSESTLTFNNSQAFGNFAQADGGAIAAMLESDLQLLGGSMTQNFAVGQGGAVSSDESSVFVAGIRFEGNTGNVRGGAIALVAGSLTAQSPLFTGNTSNAGAGVFNLYGAVDIRSGPDATFVDNIAAARGGGMLNLGSSDVYLGGVTFLRNRTTGAASRGGALSNGESVVTLDNCIFDENESFQGAGMHNFDSRIHAIWTGFVRNNAVGAGGGAMNIGSRVELIRCGFELNTTTATGGGMHSEQQTDANDVIFVQNCEFIENEAHDAGGALHFDEVSVAEVSNSVFSRNRLAAGGGTGGAIRAETSFVRVVNSSFSRNQAVTTGGGLSADLAAVLDIDNAILWENSDVGGTRFEAQIWLMPLSGSSALIDHSCVMNLPAVLPPGAGIGLTSLDPLFVDPANDDLQLQAGSPCIDAGNNAMVPPDQFNLDDDADTGEPLPLDKADAARFVDDLATLDCPYMPGSCGAAPIVDMGAYEFAGAGCPGDVDGDGDVDLSDLSLVLANFGLCADDPGFNAGADFDQSGCTDLSDLARQLASFGCS